MKNILILILIFTISISSCTGPEGPPGQDGSANFSIAYFTISNWILSDDNTYFYADVDYPELTPFVYNEGLTVGYLMQNFDSELEYQVPLPFDIYNNTEEASWTETISFDFIPGSIRFYYEPSDFFTGFTPPVSTFKIALVW